MKENQIKHHWRENVKPMLMFIFAGALIVLGMRLMETAWPEKAAKVYICFVTDKDVEACERFHSDE